VDTEDWESPIWRDSRFKYLLNLEEKPLIRDRYCLAYFSWLKTHQACREYGVNDL